jgi:hypothetical protein
VDIHTYLQKYGYRGLSVAVGEFIRRAPEFRGDQELAKVLGEMIADLESALQSIPQK